MNRSSTFGGEILYEIRCPPGVQGLYADGFGPKHHEYELLLQGSQPFIIVEANRYAGGGYKWHVILEAVVQ